VRAPTDDQVWDETALLQRPPGADVECAQDATGAGHDGDRTGKRGQAVGCRWGGIHAVDHRHHASLFTASRDEASPAGTASGFGL
jgi:hypothetical protein